MEKQRMKNTVLWVCLFILFSIVAEMALTIVTVRADAGIQLIDERDLKLSYIYIEEKNQLVLDFQHKSEERQRLKIKITDAKDQVIDYSEAAHMVEENGWLLEENFSGEKAGKLTLDLASAAGKHRLYVQMDQQKVTDNDQVTIEENNLERTAPYILETATAEQGKTSASEKASTKASSATIEASSEKFIGPKQTKINQTGASA